MGSRPGPFPTYFTCAPPSASAPAASASPHEQQSLKTLKFPRSCLERAGGGSCPAWFHGATCSCRATWGWNQWELLRESGFSWKMLIYQESVFNGNASNFMHFLAGDEISGQNLGEKERKPKIATSLWLKAIAGERINPCTLSSSRLGDCVHLCQRDTNFYGQGYGTWLGCRKKPSSVSYLPKITTAGEQSGSHQAGKAPAQVPTFSPGSVWDVGVLCNQLL